MQPTADHDHDHGDGHEHRHQEHPSGVLGRLRSLFAPHSHDAADTVDQALEDHTDGVRTLKLSLAILGVTAVLQAAVVILSGSVALLGDTLHNASDALTALPLWLAFSLGRRPPTKRFTYGYGRSEDLAGVCVVVLIAVSSALAAWEAVRRLLHPQHINHLPFVMVAALVGVAGNEVVASMRIRVGRRIGSAALVADGLHARTDGLTSAAVLLGAIGVALGAQWADPVVGLLVSVAILRVLVQAARTVGERLLDAVDPALVASAEHVLGHVQGVAEVGELRIRWVGHRLHADARITVDRDLGIVAAHEIAERAYHDLLHQVPRLAEAVIHTDPCSHDGSDPHDGTGHHRLH